MRTGDECVEHRPGIELQGAKELIGKNVGDLKAALRIEANQPSGGIRIGEATSSVDGGVAAPGAACPLFGQRADVVQYRMLVPELVGEDQSVADPVFGPDGGDVLRRDLKVAIEKPIVGLAGNAERSDRRTRDSVVGNAEIGQPVQIGVDVVGPHREIICRRPLYRRQTTPAIVGGEIAFGDIGNLPHAVHADGERRRDHLVDVEGDALGAVARELGIGVVEAGEIRWPAW